MHGVFAIAPFDRATGGEARRACALRAQTNLRRVTARRHQKVVLQIAVTAIKR